MKDTNIEDITKKLEQGVKDLFEGENYHNFLVTMSKFYNYSFNNCLLIAMQMPEATRVAGYKSWQTNFKRNVKKGEKAIKILAPIPKKFVKVVELEDGSVEEKEINYMRFRAVPVFDISQTEGEELPEICKMLDGSVEGFEEVIKRVQDASPVDVEYKEIEGGANGYYSHDTNSIVVDERLSEQQKVKTLIHEIAHAILHNKEDGAEKEADKRTREVQAESVAYTVASYLGIDTSEYSFGYVAGWSAGKDAKELVESMDVIRNTAKMIIENIEGTHKKVCES